MAHPVESGFTGQRGEDPGLGEQTVCFSKRPIMKTARGWEGFLS